MCTLQESDEVLQEIISSSFLQSLLDVPEERNLCDKGRGGNVIPLIPSKLILSFLGLIVLWVVE